MDGLKELVEAFSARIKSPIIGSIVLAFIAINWKPLFFLLFSGESAEDKFLFLSCNTTGYSLYLYPVIAGLVFAFCLPWINFWGAKAIELPVSKHRNMQLDAAHDLDEKKMRYAHEIDEKKMGYSHDMEEAKTRHAIDMEAVDAAYRNALLESAKVDQEIKTADIDEEIRTDLEEKFAGTKGVNIAEIKEVQEPLSETSENILGRAAMTSSGRITLLSREGTYYSRSGTIKTGDFGGLLLDPSEAIDRKEFLREREAVAELVKIGYMKQSSETEFDLTKKGYDFLENLQIK